jgi:hypothetical protein
MGEGEMFVRRIPPPGAFDSILGGTLILHEAEDLDMASDLVDQGLSFWHYSPSCL